MDLFWWALIFVIALVAASLWFGHAEQERILGSEAALRNLRYSIRPLILSLLLGFVISFVILSSEKYGLASLYVLGTGLNFVLLILCFLRKKEIGPLLADIGRTSQNKYMFRMGLIFLVITVLQMGLFFMSVSNGVPKYNKLELEVSRLAHWVSMTSFLIALGLEKTVFISCVHLLNGKE
jgi:hypothetical protein